MNAEMVYGCISRWLDKYPKNMDIKVVLETKELMDACRKEMMDNEAKKQGNKSIQTAAKRIIKNAVKNFKGLKDYMCGMFVNTKEDGTNVYCVCDGYHLVRFNEKLPLEEADTSQCEPINLNKICVPVSNAVEIELPNIIDVKLASKVRAYPNDKKDKSIKPICINNEINLWVNPAYLLDMMECLPNAKAYAGSNKQSIYFKAKNGDGVLSPVNHKKDD